jgi:hypothetical protein
MTQHEIGGYLGIYDPWVIAYSCADETYYPIESQRYRQRFHKGENKRRELGKGKQHIHRT